MESLTEGMFYVLMAYVDGEKCGIEAAAFVERVSDGRVMLGPATLYTILGRFVRERYLEEIDVDGRKRTYRITERGKNAYQAEIDRLHTVLRDAQKLWEGGFSHEDGHTPDPLPAV